MQKPLLRVPFTGQFPSPLIIPKTANTATGGAVALINFLTSPSSSSLSHHNGETSPKSVILTGAGISVSSGLADYRGTNGTYTLNKTYRPIYYNEFCSSHEARKRYWARSYLGFPNLLSSKPNGAHYAVHDLYKLGLVSSVITQNVDSFHRKAHPDLKTLELHGYLRSTVCLSCQREFSRELFQERLSALNPAWKRFLEEALESGALATEHPEERRKKGLRTNPDGDVDLPAAPYNTFRYPACPQCLDDPPRMKDGRRGSVEIDADGAWSPTSTSGILKPAVIMFGESIPAPTKTSAENAIDSANRLLVLGSSLATYSAWRLVKRAKERNMPIGIVNLGGARGEEIFFEETVNDAQNGGERGVRCSERLEKLLPRVVEEIKVGKVV